MLLIFGSHGYVGSAIARECEARKMPWRAGERGDYKELVFQIVKSGTNVSRLLVINAAAFIPNPTVDACKDHPDETILGNVVFPSNLVSACMECGVPLMHLSTGCLFDEQKEYTEEDVPTRGWDGYCGFYVGTKLLAEKVVSRYEDHYILRLRLPFDEVDHPRNYLTKLTKFDRVFEHFNSLTHRGDFAKWALDLWQNSAPFGTYHAVNTFQITAAAVVIRMMEMGIIRRMPQIVRSPDTTGARLSNDRLVKAGVPVRAVEYAVCEALEKWRKNV